MASMGLYPNAVDSRQQYVLSPLKFINSFTNKSIVTPEERNKMLQYNNVENQGDNTTPWLSIRTDGHHSGGEEGEPLPA